MSHIGRSRSRARALVMKKEDQPQHTLSNQPTGPQEEIKNRRRKRSDDTDATPPTTGDVNIAPTQNKKKKGTSLVVAPVTEVTALHTLAPLFRATVVARPSKVVRSPYLADVQLIDSKETVLCHTPSLGCMGLISAGAAVLVAQAQANSTAKSTHILHHVEVTEPDDSKHIVGTHPMTANLLARSLLLNGAVLGPIESVDKEVTLGGSRFDFVAHHADGSKTVVEVKNVPLADHADGDKKARKASQEEAAAAGPIDHYGKMAIFPEGYTKKKGDPVSPRALKHAQELQAIAEAGEMKACMVFIVQRTDVNRLRITTCDPTYRAAIREAVDKGVMIKAFAIRWDGSTAMIHKELPLDWGGEDAA